MRIILVRHGKPALPGVGWIKAGEFGRMIDVYNSAGIEKTPHPASKLITIAQSCRVIVCSDLPRSVESAEVLGAEKIVLSDAMFRECDLPYMHWPLLKMSPYVWIALFRMLWLIGFSRDSESFSAARARAEQCTGTLRSLAAKYDDVLFMGHYLLNRFIARELRASGWKGPISPGHRFWDHAVYTCPEPG